MSWCTQHARAKVTACLTRYRYKDWHTLHWLIKFTVTSKAAAWRRPVVPPSSSGKHLQQCRCSSLAFEHFNVLVFLN